MGAPRIRAEYDNLAQIAKAFSKNSEATQSEHKKLASKMETLKNGHWIGKGADAFYSEMESSILPSVKGLADALAMAARVTRGIIKIMEETDEDAARLFQILDVSGLKAAISAAAAGVAGAAGAAAAASQGLNSLLARDPASLFSPNKLRALIGLQIKGAGSELGAAMNDYLKNPSKGKAENLIIIIIKLRGRPEAEIRVEFEKFEEAVQQRNAAKPEAEESFGGGGSQSYMGSMTQMRYGSVVGDAFGMDPTFGAMLNPGGGLIGPGKWAFAGPDTAVGYHKIAHDAAGYLHNYHQVGPGYDYMGGSSGASSNPNAGHTAGLSFWRKAVGSSTGSSTLGSPSQRSQVGGMNRISPSIDRVADIY
jgi:WXG100 family type VII secretion target